MARTANHIMQKIFETLQELRQVNEKAPHLGNLEDTLRHVGLMEHLFPSWVILGFDIYKSRPDYLSENGQNLFGLSANTLSGFSADDFFARIHPDDVACVHQAFVKVESFVKSQATGSILAEYRFLINYRFRHANGRYIHLCQEKTTYQDHLFMMLFKDITAVKPFTHVRLEIMKHTSALCQKVEEYVPAQQMFITSREMEILQHIKAGLSSKEIADRLYISPHTVRNHRSRLFEKTNSSNVIELLNYASSANLL